MIALRANRVPAQGGAALLAANENEPDVRLAKFTPRAVPIYNKWSRASFSYLDDRYILVVPYLASDIQLYKMMSSAAIIMRAEMFRVLGDTESDLTQGFASAPAKKVNEADEPFLSKLCNHVYDTCLSTSESVRGFITSFEKYDEGVVKTKMKRAVLKAMLDADSADTETEREINSDLKHLFELINTETRKFELARLSVATGHERIEDAESKTEAEAMKMFKEIEKQQMAVEKATECVCIRRREFNLRDNKLIGAVRTGNKFYCELAFPAANANGTDAGKRDSVHTIQRIHYKKTSDPYTHQKSYDTANLEFVASEATSTKGYPLWKKAKTVGAGLTRMTAGTLLLGEACLGVAYAVTASGVAQGAVLTTINAGVGVASEAILSESIGAAIVGGVAGSGATAVVASTLGIGLAVYGLGTAAYKLHRTRKYKRFKKEEEHRLNTLSLHEQVRENSVPDLELMPKNYTEHAKGLDPPIREIIFEVDSKEMNVKLTYVPRVRKRTLWSDKHSEEIKMIATKADTVPDSPYLWSVLESE